MCAGPWARPPVQKRLLLQRLSRTLNVSFAKNCQLLRHEAVDLVLRCRYKTILCLARNKDEVLEHTPGKP